MPFDLVQIMLEKPSQNQVLEIELGYQTIPRDLSARLTSDPAHINADTNAVNRRIGLLHHNGVVHLGLSHPTFEVSPPCLIYYQH